MITLRFHSLQRAFGWLPRAATWRVDRRAIESWQRFAALYAERGRL